MSGRRDRGQALPEFALVIPVFLLIIFGLFDVGRAVFMYNGLTNAAREAARLAIVNQDEALVLQRAEDMALGSGITTAAADVVAFYRRNPDTDDVESNEPCDNSDPEHSIAVGCVAVVIVEAPWEPITPLIGNIIGPITLTGRSELPIEFVCPNPGIAAYATAANCPRQP